jgi:hypothetical protein
MRKLFLIAIFLMACQESAPQKCVEGLVEIHCRGKEPFRIVAAQLETRCFLTTCYYTFRACDGSLLAGFPQNECTWRKVY